ncbi:hypothetical protein [Nocardia terpenica]|uniref:hypothetical protein n=1 Tax=Nocardia terpenica TaxID=455432 RepID=UPI0012FDF3AB|nr:hypothetical protein [Nocardia terpenica]
MQEFISIQAGLRYTAGWSSVDDDVLFNDEKALDPAALTSSPPECPVRPLSNSATKQAAVVAVSASNSRVGPGRPCISIREVYPMSEHEKSGIREGEAAKKEAQAEEERAEAAAQEARQRNQQKQ